MKLTDRQKDLLLVSVMERKQYLDAKGPIAVGFGTEAEEVHKKLLKEYEDLEETITSGDVEW